MATIAFAGSEKLLFAQDGTRPKRPNVIIIYADDIGYGDLSCYGATKVQTPNIHHPFTPAPRFKGTSQCGRYGDFIHELDWMVAEILKTLDDLELTEKTLVIFTSDNGGMFNDGGKDAWQAGHYMNSHLLGFKFGAWEGGHRIPFIVRWPGHVKAGSRSSQLLCNVDLLATMAALLGQKLEIDNGVDSFNMLEALLSDTKIPIRDHVVLAPRFKSNLALRKGKWIYISGQGDGGFANDRGGPRAVALSKRKNSDIDPNGEIRKDAPKQQLYDLYADVSQKTNVIREHPEIAEQLKELLSTCQKQSRTAPVP